MKNEFYFNSSDECTQIHAIEWIPEEAPRAVIQICHGMAEYIERYDDFAEFLSLNGYYVVGHDHLGHGESISSSDKLGFFREKNGNEYVLTDIHNLRVQTQEKYPELPYIIMGHDMGSFLVRQYIGVYGAGLSGAIVMGTSEQPTAILRVGKAIIRVLAFCFNWNYRSPLVDNMVVGAYDKHFANEEDGSNWLSRNPEIVRKYQHDPKCGYMFTVNAYYHMFAGMIKMNQQEKEGKMPKRLPILLISGKKDPVGNFGKGVKKVYKKYKECGMQDVQMKLYPDDRHEILNELDRKAVFIDIWKWLANRV